MKPNEDEVNAKSAVVSDVIADFHAKRLLFVIVKDRLVVENAPSGLSHNKWFEKLNLEEEQIDYILDNCVRGYFYNNNLALYKGLNFDGDREVLFAAMTYINEFEKGFNMDDKSLVSVGLNPIKNTIFEPQYTLGAIDDVRKLSSFINYISSIRRDNNGI